MQKVIDATTKMDAVLHWKATSASKAEVARLFNISPRTLNRAIEKYDTRSWTVTQVGTDNGLDEDNDEWLDSDLEVDEGDEVDEVDEPFDEWLADYKFICSDRSITMYRNDVHASLDRDSAPETFSNVMELLARGDYGEAWEQMNPAIRIQRFSHHGVTIEEGEVFLNGFHVKNTMALRLIEMFHSNSSKLEKSCMFFKKLMQNSDFDVVEGLFDYMGQMECEINDDGTFVAYKAVSHDLKDKWTGLIDNSPGQSPSMPYGMIDKNRDVGCSQGLHVSSFDYALGYGGSNDKIIEVVVSPENVVCVPHNTGYQKIRTCGYTVTRVVQEIR